MSIGAIGIITGDGGITSDYNQVFVANLTGSAGDCTTASTFPLVCDNLNITDWTMEIDYTPQVGSPTSQTDMAGVNGAPLVISPNADPFASILDASLLFTDPNNSNLITRIVFTGSLSQTSFTIFTAPPALSPPGTCQGGSGTPVTDCESTFFAQSPFTFIYTPAPANYPGAGTGFIFDVTDLLVTDATGGPGPGPSIPEPASIVMLATGVLALGVRRFLLR